LDKESDLISKQADARMKRYLQKIKHGQSRCALLHEWLGEKGLETDLRTTLAIDKAFQEVAEVMMDLLAMMLKDRSIPPLDDYTNITKVIEEGLLPKAAEPILRETNGLRNKLIHVYNDIDGAIVLRNVRNLLPQLESYLGVIEAWVKQTKPR
jgi:uncharacterized protein YutE (UPF0331/DUF86 family)